MSEQAKHTEAEYAESAEKYGITAGPWSATGCLVRAGDPSSKEGASWMCDTFSPLSRYNTIYVKEDEARARAIATLPDLLIERDRMAGQLLRLREACDVALAETNKRHGFVKRDGKYGDWRDQIAAALAEGGAA